MRRVVEDCLPLDSNRLAKDGVFSHDEIRKLEWTSGESASILYQAPDLLLCFTQGGKLRLQSIRVTMQACTAGGVRYYFRCPGCQVRRYRLRQGGNGLFLCPSCHDLPYYLQQAGEDHKLIHRLHKAENTLFSKPMRKRKREALIGRWVEIDNQIEHRGQQRFGPLPNLN